jgi:hypothetical protein
MTLRTLKLIADTLEVRVRDLIGTLLSGYPLLTGLQIIAV